MVGLLGTALALTAACGDEEANGSPPADDGGARALDAPTSLDASDASDGGADTLVMMVRTLRCEKQRECLPKTFAAKYGSIEACVADRIAPPGTPGTDGFADAAGCLARIAAGGCGEEFPECNGTLPAQTPCNYHFQCAAGLCSSGSETSCDGRCSTPRVPAKEGEACRPLECEEGFYCADAEEGRSRCARGLGEGADCSGPGALSRCGQGLTCYPDNRKCGKPRGVGSPCFLAGLDCQRGLSCVRQDASILGICEEEVPRYIETGGSCVSGDLDAGTCRDGRCLDGVCVANAKEGEPCTSRFAESKPFCADYFGFVCLDGGCVKRAYCK